MPEEYYGLSFPFIDPDEYRILLRKKLGEHISIIHKYGALSRQSLDFVEDNEERLGPEFVDLAETLIAIVMLHNRESAHKTVEDLLNDVHF